MQLLRYTLNKLRIGSVPIASLPIVQVPVPLGRLMSGSAIWWCCVIEI